MAAQGLAICWVRQGHGSNVVFGEGLRAAGRTGFAGPEGDGGDSPGSLSLKTAVSGDSPLANSPALGSVMLFSKCESSGTSPCHFVQDTAPYLPQSWLLLEFLFPSGSQKLGSRCRAYPFPTQPVHRQALPMLPLKWPWNPATSPHLFAPPSAQVTITLHLPGLLQAASSLASHPRPVLLPHPRSLSLPGSQRPLRNTNPARQLQLRNCPWLTNIPIGSTKRSMTCPNHLPTSFQYPSIRNPSL